MVPDVVRLDLAATTGTAAIEELVVALGGVEGMGDAGRVCAETLAREALNSTALEIGVALPHARTTAVDRILVAVGRSAGGVRFDGCEVPVRVIFLIATPPAMVREYLAEVAGILRCVRREGGLDALLTTRSEAEFVVGLSQ